MARPITLFTGQWADMPLEVLAPKAEAGATMGWNSRAGAITSKSTKALEDDGYIKRKRDLLEEHGLQCFAISNHLVGQAVADKFIDERHQGIVPPHVWGDGDPEGVRQRAAEEIKNTARAAAAFGVKQVNGFTGTPDLASALLLPAQ